jgi:hypothetical protein
MNRRAFLLLAGSVGLVSPQEEAIGQLVPRRGSVASPEQSAAGQWQAPGALRLR